jgi:hypothetical protein
LHAWQTHQLLIGKRMMCATTGASGFHRFLWVRTPFLVVKRGSQKAVAALLETNKARLTQGLNNANLTWVAPGPSELRTWCFDLRTTCINPLLRMR